MKIENSQSDHSNRFDSEATRLRLRLRLRVRVQVGAMVRVTLSKTPLPSTVSSKAA